MLLLGCFLALSYLACVSAGFVADRWLGSFGAILVGSICLAIGYGILALDRTELLGLALKLQRIGHGLFKPGISVSTGQFYSVCDARRGRSFMVQHVAVNVGAMAGPLCSEWSRAHGWSTMFRWAACGCQIIATSRSSSSAPSGAALVLLILQRSLDRTLGQTATVA